MLKVALDSQHSDRLKSEGEVLEKLRHAHIVELFGPAMVAYYAFMLVGFFLSVMWSVIFSLALNSVPGHHGSFSGILCTGIIGGAFMSFAVGWLGERFGLRVGMSLVFLSLAYVLAVGLRARPLIDNATTTLRELLKPLTRR